MEKDRKNVPFDRGFIEGISMFYRGFIEAYRALSRLIGLFEALSRLIEAYRGLSWLYWGFIEAYRYSFPHFPFLPHNCGRVSLGYWCPVLGAFNAESFASNAGYYPSSLSLSAARHHCLIQNRAVA